MKKILIRTLKLLIVFYILICIALFFFQEKMIFFPEKLNKNFRFGFEGNYEEISIQTADQKLLNGILFRSDTAKGLIFYLHGNAGSINSWGEVATTYTVLGYDVFLIDYRGYGKSEGSIRSQEQLFSDIQAVYDEMKKRYAEDKIVVLGYSIGTGLASKIASVNNPKLLILQAPYYSLTDMMRRTYPIIPTFLLKYKLRTEKFIRDCKMPIVLFHGNQDEVIPYNSSIRLKKLLKTTDTLIILEGQAHNGMTDNPEYKREIKRILNQ
jgi:uncharacterized protein